MIIGAMPFGCGAAYYIGYVDDRSFRGGARDDPDGEWTDEERWQWEQQQLLEQHQHWGGQQHGSGQEQGVGQGAL